MATNAQEALALLLPYPVSRTKQANFFFQGVSFLVHHIASLGQCCGFCGLLCPSDSALSANALKLNIDSSDCEIILSSV